MISGLRDRLTYANVTATIALFIALGGTSYAALSLPRNSVGSAQIRAGGVRSSEVKNRSLRLSDLSVSARQSLRGAKGDAGAQGPAGTPAVKYFAALSAAGETRRGNATAVRHTAIGSGVYTVSFAQSVSGCAYGATIGTTDGGAPPAGRAVVFDAGGAVGVQTHDAAGNAADLPFHLIVAC